MIKRKRYSDDFKEKIVLEILSGQSKMSEISQREGISPYTISKWRDKYNNLDFSNQHKEEIVLRRRIADLEATVAELALENNILKKARQLMKEYERKEKLSKAIYQKNSVQ